MRFIVKPPRPFDYVPHANHEPRRIATAQVFLAPADHARLMALAASHERSAAAEARWAVRQWIEQNEQPPTAPAARLAGEAPAVTTAGRV
jgi:hypothetical protein